jgi:hypothetical protein
MRRILLTIALALPLAIACAQPADPPTPTGPRGAKRYPRPTQEDRQLPPPYFAPEILEFRERLEKEDPAEFKRLEELKRTDRKAFRQEMSKHVPRKYRDNLENRLITLDRECWALSREIQKAASPTERDALMAQLREKNSEMLELFISQTKTRLQEMTQRVQVLEVNREQILQKKLDFYLNAPPPPEEENDTRQPAPPQRNGKTAPPAPLPPPDNIENPLPPPPPGQ